jgi:hypothetical protein
MALLLKAEPVQRPMPSEKCHLLEYNPVPPIRRIPPFRKTIQPLSSGSKSMSIKHKALIQKSVNLYQATLRHNIEDSILHSHRKCEPLLSQTGMILDFSVKIWYTCMWRPLKFGKTVCKGESAHFHTWPRSNVQFLHESKQNLCPPFKCVWHQKVDDAEWGYNWNGNESGGRKMIKATTRQNK